MLFFKFNTQKILLKSKDIYFFTKNKYPLILIKFNSLINLLNFIKIKKNYIVLINIEKLTFKKYLDLSNYFLIQTLFIFLIQKNLILFKIKQIFLFNISFLKKFNFI